MNIKKKLFSTAHTDFCRGQSVVLAPTSGDSQLPVIPTPKDLTSSSAFLRPMHSDASTHPDTCTHTCAYRHTHMHTYVHEHIHIHTYVHTYVHTHAHAHLCTCTHAQRHTCVYTH